MFISSNTLELTDVQQMLKKKKKELEIAEIFAKDDTLIIEKSDVVRARMKKKNGGLVLNPYFPTLGNAVQMISSVLFLFLFYALQVRFSIFVAIVAGQVFSLAYYFPKSNKLVLDVAKVLRKQG